MKLTRRILILVVLGFCFASAQVRVSGSLHSALYTFDTPMVEQGNFYQGLNFKIFPASNPDLYFNTNLRLAWQGKNKMDERVYNMYANVKTAQDRLQFRLGRQFLYEGVINGTMDGLLVSAEPAKNLVLKAFAGLEAPFRRTLETVGSDSSALGAYLSYKFSPLLKADVSYFQRKRDDQTIWNLVGAALHGVYNNSLYYQAQLDHNLESEELQGARFRANYYWKKWSMIGEYNFQRPRIFEDSFFRIFRQQQYQQFRGGLTYDFDPVQVGIQYLFTDHEYDQTNQVILNAGNRWGTLGVVMQGGYAGDDFGLYGDVRYPLLDNLTLKGYGSYSNYQRYLVEISEDAIAFSGGVDYRPVDYLSLQADVQQSSNSFYDNDVRGLFRIFYWFRR